MPERKLGAYAALTLASSMVRKVSPAFAAGIYLNHANRMNETFYVPSPH